jgi:hypothetical protein
MSIPFFNTNYILNVNKNNDNHNISNTSSRQKKRIENSRKKRQNLRSVALYVDGAGENPKEHRLMQMVHQLFESSDDDDDDDDYNDNKSDTNPMRSRDDNGSSSDNNNKPKEHKLTQIGSSVDVHNDNNKDNNNISKEHQQMQQLFESSDDDDDDSDNNNYKKKRKEQQRIQELLESSDDDDFSISIRKYSNDPWTNAVMDAIVKLNDKNGSSLKDILRVMIPYKGRPISRKHIENVMKRVQFSVFKGKYKLNKNWWWGNTKNKKNKKSKKNNHNKINRASIAKCILSLNERKGTSLPSIKKYLKVTNNRKTWPRINKAIQSCVKRHIFIQVKRKYKLASTVREEVRQIISEINHSKNRINGSVSLKEIESKLYSCCSVPEDTAFVKKFLSGMRRKTNKTNPSIIVKVQNPGSRSKDGYVLNLV